MTEESTKKGTVSSAALTVYPKGSVRRNSTGKEISRSALSPFGSEGKCSSRYLSPSVNSCHDRCKYGGKHTFDDNGEHAISPKSFRNKAIPGKEEKLDNSSNAERRKKLVGKQKVLTGSRMKPSDMSGSRSRGTSVLTKSIDSVECNGGSRQSVSSSFRKSESSVNLDVVEKNSASNVEDVDAFEEVTFVNRNFPDVQKFEISEVTETIKQEHKVLSSLNKGVLHEQLEIIEPNASPDEVGSVKGPDSGKKNSLPMKKASSSAKSKANEVISPASRRAVLSAKNVNMETTLTTRKVDASSKRATASAVKETTAKMKSKPPIMKSRSPLKISRVPSSKTNNNNKIIKREVLPSSADKKVVRPQGSVSRKPPTKIDPPLKSRDTKSSSRKNKKLTVKSEVRDSNVKENTLSVISNKEESVDSNSMQLGNADCQSSPPSVPPSSSPLASVHGDEKDFEDSDSETTYSEECETLSDSLSEYDMETDQVGDSKDENRKMLRRSVMVHPHETDSGSHKLKFRRGKVVDLQSEDNGPRRLRFRKAREHGGNHNDKEGVHRRSFRRKKEIGCDDLTNPNSEAQAVMLRHQGMQDKKDAQGLFNDVIEVTATKLVETRKSKVKALVGAFETVISLQETKPASLV